MIAGAVSLNCHKMKRIMISLFAVYTAYTNVWIMISARRGRR